MHELAMWAAICFLLFLKCFFTLCKLERSGCPAFHPFVSCPQMWLLLCIKMNLCNKTKMSVNYPRKTHLKSSTPGNPSHDGRLSVATLMYSFWEWDILMWLKYIVIVSSHSPSDFGCWVDSCDLHGLISEVEFSKASIFIRVYVMEMRWLVILPECPDITDRRRSSFLYMEIYILLIVRWKVP